jgi:hypothetical protein
MNTYKYATEEAVNMQLFKYQVLQQDELDKMNLSDQFNNEFPCTIYFICSRPRIIVDINYLEQIDNNVILKFKEQKEFDFIEHFIKCELPEDVGDLKLISKFPYNYCELRDEKGLLIGGKSAYLLDHFKNQIINSRFGDFHVLYIGQSVDEYETIPTIKRIKKHDRLQKIYSEAVKDFPDNEIYLLLTSFKQNNFVELKGNTQIPSENEEGDLKKFKKLIVNPSKFTLKQRTTFCEAALIRYFQPKYNIEYKKTFPRQSHTSYSECYESDINAVMFELDFSEINSAFYTDSVERKFYHEKKYYLHNEYERRKMFLD